MITRERILKANARGLAEKISGIVIPDPFFSCVLNAAYDAGLEGIDLSECESVKRNRRGNPPKSGISYNYRDQRSEGGCSVISEGCDILSLLFMENRPLVEVEGILLPFKGSDNEELLLLFGDFE